MVTLSPWTFPTYQVARLAGSAKQPHLLWGILLHKTRGVRGRLDRHDICASALRPNFICLFPWTARTGGCVATKGCHDVLDMPAFPLPWGISLYNLGGKATLLGVAGTWA